MPHFQDAFLFFDGGMGTMLQAAGLAPGELPERLNLTAPDAVRAVHRAYVQAGSDVITANTFGANALKFGAETDAVVEAGVRLARESGARYVALDIGPTGALMEPLGTLSFDSAYALFAQVVEAGARSGADMVLIETMSDLYEMRAALLAAKEHCRLPVLATMTFSQDGRTFLGADPETAAITLQALGADALGVNCSLGPTETVPIVARMAAVTRTPLIVQPNAGMPRMENGRTLYDVTPEAFAGCAAEMAALGVTVFGGCCGTTPAHIRALRARLSSLRPARRADPHLCAFASGQRAVILQGGPAVVGERINPTGKRRLKEALRAGDDAYVVREALDQQDAGADLLDVNAGLPDIDEAAVLPRLVRAIQAVSPLPLQIDSADPRALEAAVRACNGKPIINSVCGKEESLRAVLPIARRYGAAVVALTLDEGGIPDTAEGRLAIAGRILQRALDCGIAREDVLIDCLTMTASTHQAQAMETLRAVRLIRERLGLRTVLGVSNISFGLPARESLNAAFLAAALEAGLDLPILNPLGSAMQTVRAFRVLCGQDAAAADYIAHCASLPTPAPAVPAAQAAAPAVLSASGLRGLILGGRAGEIVPALRALLPGRSALELINGEFIPALDEAGARFERGELFLPQLMACADAVKAGFDYLRGLDAAPVATKGPIILATVKDDIHDIGKNIVRMLLENYGYRVIDLGRDVAPERVVEAALRERAPLVGLSALMTTTVGSMQRTIEALRAANAPCRVMVGGAVLTEEYARMVGADFYARDAAESARIAAQVIGD